MSSKDIKKTTTTTKQRQQQHFPQTIDYNENTIDIKQGEKSTTSKTTAITTTTATKTTTLLHVQAS